MTRNAARHSSRGSGSLRYSITTDPITKAAADSIAELITVRAALDTARPAPAQIDSEFNDRLAEQPLRHAFERNEKFHAFDCMQIEQRTRSQQEEAEQRRRRAQHATRIAVILMWLSAATLMASDVASIVWACAHLGSFSPGHQLAWGLGILSGDVISNAGGALAVVRAAGMSSNRPIRTRSARISVAARQVYRHGGQLAEDEPGPALS